MSESSSVISKVLETETGKYVAKKFFSRLETTLKSNSNQREVDGLLDAIAPIDGAMKQEIFDKVTDRYLSFRTLLSRDADVFIDEIYHPLKIVSLGTKEDPITLEDDCEFFFPKIACIVGKAGQGKTTILRKMFLNLLTSPSGGFPLIITLRKIDWNDIPVTPAKLVSKEFANIGLDISEDACSHLLQLDRLRILFDGFDEIEGIDREFALNIITQTYVTYGAKCVVTTRPGTEIQLYGGEIQNYELMDLEREDVIKIINKHSKISELDKKQLLDAIQSKHDIANILLTPIIVDIFISTYNSLVAEPTTIVDFYEQLFQTLASSHDRLKVMFRRKGTSGLSVNQLEQVFWTASYRLLNKRNDVTFRQTEISEAFDYAVDKLGFEAPEAYLDVINKTSLIKQDGLEYSYLHKSIAEFHAAKHIKSLSDEARKGYYRTILDNYRVSHENVLRYLSKLDQDLFHISFVAQLLDEIAKISNIRKDIENRQFSFDILFVLAPYDSVIVNYKPKKWQITLESKKELDARGKKLKSLFLMLSSILDIHIPSIKSSSLLAVVRSKFKTEHSLVGREHDAVIVEGEGEDRTYNYKFSLDEILELREVEQKITLPLALETFYAEVAELEETVVQRINIYKKKNALNQFY
ncbi:NACHT domain-containing protein [Vibrio coralliilyticus]|uniref:NACHT domain-containing protein n=1 Tax=Vibrio coralliilyticus TaxID=190893 RepID=UPI0018174743|nr:NACHT domain-containing protein [Vibrio coralliilyticus]NUW69910.1 NACHT domain-containing protein [Vibrio coralliilyticus]